MRRFLVPGFFVFSLLSWRCTTLEPVHDVHVPSGTKPAFAYQISAAQHQEVASQIASCKDAWRYLVLNRDQVRQLYRRTNMRLVVGTSLKPLREQHAAYAAFGDRLMIGSEPDKLIATPNQDLQGIDALHVASVPGHPQKTEQFIDVHARQEFFPRSVTLTMAMRNFLSSADLIRFVTRLKGKLDEHRQGKCQMTVLLVPGASRVPFAEEEHREISDKMYKASTALLSENTLQEIWVGSDGYRAHELRRRLPPGLAARVRWMRHEFAMRPSSRYQRQADALFLVEGTNEEWEAAEGVPLKFWLAEPTGVSMYLNDAEFRALIDG